MRENCTHGSEGGEGESSSLPLSAFGVGVQTITYQNIAFFNAGNGTQIIAVMI